jgi:S-formylglutathione hydrolase FrmB
MKCHPHRLLVWVAVALLAPPVAFGQALPVKTVQFDSPSVGRAMKYNVVLPAKYDQTTDRYPVLYLLHGLTGNYTNWGRMGVPRYAREYDLIVVMPDAGNSWYANWSKSDEGQKNNWEDAIVKDLIGHVDATYRTIARREGRAINGLSMGGYGAIMLGLRHPDLFCSIGSHSGALSFARQAAERIKNGQQARRPGNPPSTTPTPGIDIEGFSSPAERTPKGTLWATVEDCAAYDPFQLVLKTPKEKLPHIYLDCGTEDGLIRSQRALVKLLDENKITYTAGEAPGAHNGQYWTREVGVSMAVQHAVIQRNLAATRSAAAGGQ